jgi:hypothetical protein
MPATAEPSDHLGRHRWMVERTHAWFVGFRCLVPAMSGVTTSISA